MASIINKILGRDDDYEESRSRSQSHPLKSTNELGYLDPIRICVDDRYSGLGAELLCSICHNVLWKPVACTKCENAFCTQCIRTWITKKKHSTLVTCPFNCMFQEKRPPPILNSLLSKLQFYCAFTPYGCQQVLPYDSLETHERTCPVKPAPCQICKKLVLHGDGNEKHELRRCFQDMYDKDPDHIQAQFIKLLDVVEDSQRRIEALEKLLVIQTQKTR